MYKSQLKYIQECLDSKHLLRQYKMRFLDVVSLIFTLSQRNFQQHYDFSNVWVYFFFTKVITTQAMENSLDMVHWKASKCSLLQQS